jgi:hypothetical protein
VLLRQVLYRVVGMTGMGYHAQLFCWWGLANFFLPELVFNLDPSNLCLLYSWDYGHALSYLAIFKFFVEVFNVC